jgi:hypothetical protein
MATHLSTRVPHDLGDPVLNTWILWWNARAVPFTARWWSPPILIPVDGALALSEHLAGLGIFATPIQLLGGTPLLAYNVCVVLSCALSGWFAYLLVFRLTGSRMAGLCGGVAYATAPYRAGQLSHVQVLTSQWMPAVLLGMHEYYLDRPAPVARAVRGRLVAAGAVERHYLLFFPVLIVLWLAWFAGWRRSSRRALTPLRSGAPRLCPRHLCYSEYRHVHSRSA